MISDKEEIDRVYKVLDKMFRDFTPISFSVERVLKEDGRNLSEALIEAVILVGAMKIQLEEK